MTDLYVSNMNELAIGMEAAIKESIFLVIEGKT